MNTLYLQTPLTHTPVRSPTRPWLQWRPSGVWRGGRQDPAVPPSTGLPGLSLTEIQYNTKKCVFFHNNLQPIPRLPIVKEI